jgi:subtilisin family serine protease
MQKLKKAADNAPEGSRHRIRSKLVESVLKKHYIFLGCQTARLSARRVMGRSPGLGRARVWSIFLAVITAQLLVFTQAQTPLDDGKLRGSFRSDRILIKPKSGPVNLANVHSKHRVRVLRRFQNLDDLQVLRLPEGAKVEEIIAQYRQSGLVEFAEPDYWVKASAAPDDPRYVDGTLWGLNNRGQSGGLIHADIGAADGWEILNSASNVIVAIIDTGIRYTHEDLADNVWVNPGEIPGNGIDDDRNGIVDDVHGLNAITNTGDPIDETGHGTHVAGVIGAVGNNGKGVVGVAWKVQIMACKFMDSEGMGSISDAIQCVDYARLKGAQVINASWGGVNSSSSLRTAISRARTAGIVFVAAAGNESADDDVVGNYPSGFDLDNVVSVAASTRSDALASFSNYGATTVDLVAPGSTIYSTWNSSDKNYTYLSGTSMAAPYVAGVFALMKAKFPNDTYKQLIDRVFAATDPIASLAGKCVTGGRVNLNRALEANLIANFTASALSGSPPLTVAFKDTSFGAITDRIWNFGDGSPTSAAPDPTHVFNSDGNFTVTLTVLGGAGETSVKSRSISVVANYAITRSTFDWIDPSSMTRLNLSDNGVSTAQALPFTFVFYGQPYDRIYVAANGMIGFINQGLTISSNVDLKDVSAPNAIICPMWDNLNPASGGSVRIGTTGEEPNRRTVVSWVDVPRNSTPTSTVTFQAVLEESSRQILFQYLEVQPGISRGAGRAATVGLENETGLVAAKYAFNGSPSLLENNQALLFIPQSAGGMLVTPAQGLITSGDLGGPFSPASKIYTIQNLGTASLGWLARKTVDWLEISSSGGILAAGQRTNIVVTVTEQAKLLQAGSYVDTLSFINANTGSGDTTRTISLVANGTAGALTITPESGLSSSGLEGGPFEPVSQVYTLINTGDATVNWIASNSQEWITLSAGSGSLTPGDSVTVTVSVNATAATLTAGLHADTIGFTNTTNGRGNDARKVTLNAGSIQPAKLTVESTAVHGQFRLRLTGEPGKTYAIESSPDLASWTPIWTRTLPDDGVFEFTDLDSAQLGQKFFRASLAP